MWISFHVFGLNVAIMYSKSLLVVVILAFIVKCVSYIHYHTMCVIINIYIYILIYQYIDVFYYRHYMFLSLNDIKHLNFVGCGHSLYLFYFIFSFFNEFAFNA
jgi:hypothetical protein